MLFLCSHIHVSLSFYGNTLVTRSSTHSPVKILNQGEEEVPSHRTEFIWGTNKLHLRLALPKRKKN